MSRTIFFCYHLRSSFSMKWSLRNYSRGKTALALQLEDTGGDARV